MKYLLLFLAFSYSLIAQAGCSGVAEGCTDKMCIDISDGGCAYDEGIRITVWDIKLEKNQQNEIIRSPIDNSEKHYSFNKECSMPNDQSFSCAPGGSSILAGRTYERRKHGKTYCGVSDTWDTSYQYVCIKGCSKGAPFELLNAIDWSCD